MTGRKPNIATDLFDDELLTHEEALGLVMRMAGCGEEEAEELLKQFASEWPEAVFTEQ